MRSKPPGYQFDREHERVAAGLALAALAIATPMLARWAGIEDSAPVARQVEFLAVFGLALGLVAALLTWRRWTRYRGLAAIVVGSTLTLVAVADLAETRIREAQLASFRAELDHAAQRHAHRLALLDERLLVAGLAGSTRFHDLEDEAHREHMRRRLDELAALVARRAAYRTRMRADFAVLAREWLYARSWRDQGMAEAAQLLARLEAEEVPREAAALAFVEASRRALDWFGEGDAGNGRAPGELAERVSQALAAESAFEQAWQEVGRLAGEAQRIAGRGDPGR